MEAYTPKRFFRTSKKIKNQLKSHYPDDVLKQSVNYLYAPENDDLDHIRKHPWIVLLIVKWAFIEESNIHYNRERLTSRSFNFILKQAHDLGDLVRMPTDYTDLRLFMRNISYQQFLYQRPFSITSFARQAYIFGQLPENHKIRRKFNTHYGIDIPHFIILSFALTAKFITKNEPDFTIEWFRPIAKELGWEVVHRFLETLSVSIDNLKPTLTRRNQSKGGWQEYYEQTPFLEFPLIRHGQTYTCVEPFVLYRCVENLLYDSIKRLSPEDFMASFGPIFENYLKTGMDRARVEYVTEAKLTPFLPQGASCVDYVIKNREANIFVDAKAVEMPYIGKISDNPEIVLQKIKKNAAKAIHQAFQVNHNAFNDKAGLPIKHKQESYILVVTFKELALGNGRNFYESIGKDYINKISQSISVEAIIPPENIYFITIDEFDFLMEMESQNQGAALRLIRKAVKDDEKPETRKFDFSQHINSSGVEAQKPQHLQGELDKLLETAKRLMG
ncbi:hypothetical protein P8631_10360 [Guyparkeria sp. 1SP6A2]|nr:hypothetical protein [Guyparkeria sp. 1SP6A2]